jgi:chromosome segregation protein
MHISRLELKGFKSFSDKTVLRLSPGLSVITGPNGSGKSNLIDAVRFVMGENSTRGLRADRLSSLISDSSRGKGQKYYVRMVIDNRDRRIPVQEDEIVITRYIDDKGESKYFLNRRRAQRAVVMNTLSMAGLSSRGYNIVVQGEISRISDKSPEEVRAMIEEAVGILSFDERRKQAEEELKEADVNLKVAMSRLDEVRSRIEQLERESNRANASITLKEVADELKRHILLEDLRRREARVAEIIAEVDGLSSDLGEADEERRKVAEQRKTLLDDILEIDKTRQTSSDITSTELTRVIAERMGELGRTEWTLQQTKGNKKDLATKMGDDRKSRRKASTTIRNLRRKGELARVRTRILENREVKLVPERDRLRRIIETARRETNSLQKRLTEVEGILPRVGAEFSQEEFELQKTSEQIGELEREERSASSARKLHAKRYIRWKGRADRLTSRLKMMTSEAQAFGSNLVGSLSRAEKLERGEIMIRELMAKLEAAAERVRGRLDDSFEFGTSDPRVVELVLREAGISVTGLLKDLVQYGPEVEPALVAALGEWFGAIVIGRDEDPSAISISLLNVGVTSAWLIRESEPNETVKGKSNRLIDRIEFPPELDEFLSSRIGDFILASDPTEAAVASRKGLSVVTKDGLVLSGKDSARLRAAHATKPSSLLETLRILEADLSEARRLREEILSRNIVDLKQGITEASSWLERVMEVRNAASKVLSEITDKMKAEEGLMLTEEKRLQGLRARILSLKRIRREADLRLKGLKRRLTDTRAIKRSLSLRASQVAGLVKSSESRFSQLDADIRAIEVELEGTRKRIFEVQKQKNELLQSRKNVTKRISDTAELLREADAKIRELSDAKTNLDGEISRLQNKLKESTEAKPSADERRDRLADDLRKAEDQIEEIDTRFRELQSKSSDAQRRRYGIETETASIKEKLSSLGEPKMLSPEGLDSEHCEALVKELEADLIAMGLLNMLAREQYDQQAQNYILISQRLNTLEEEKKAILDLIAEIERNKREAFLQALQTVNKSFGEYFSEVTSGSARLECERPEDPFQGGLSIMVQFPGKETRLVYGSSGGEKSVTALCLIFALQQLKPAPFYFFDEIDAHLDARNVQNYLKLVSMRASGSQLLVISLKDVVAFGADKLIGTYIKSGKSRAMEMPIVASQRVRK